LGPSDRELCGNWFDQPIGKSVGAGGLHHIALQVPDLDALAKDLAAQDMRLLEPTHVKGAGNFLCNFLSPLYTRGVTIEYVQMLGE
jgi:methylmalonyl-CoA/ethylmalonyl-CoA epimerase